MSVRVSLASAHEAGRGYAVGDHELLGELLASFQTGTLLRGAYHLYGNVGEEVCYPLHKRAFGSHHNHIDVMGLRKFSHSGEIAGVKVYPCAIVGGIAGCYV